MSDYLSLMAWPFVLFAATTLIGFAILRIASRRMPDRVSVALMPLPVLVWSVALWFDLPTMFGFRGGQNVKSLANILVDPVLLGIGACIVALVPLLLRERKNRWSARSFEAAGLFLLGLIVYVAVPGIPE